LTAKVATVKTRIAPMFRTMHPTMIWRSSDVGGRARRADDGPLSGLSGTAGGVSVGGMIICSCDGRAVAGQGRGALTTNEYGAINRAATTEWR
jgi:hypothetical protein